MNTIERKIIDLESKLAFQDDLLEALNKELIEQGRMISALQVRSQEIERKIEDISEDREQLPIDEPPPPHY